MKFTALLSALLLAPSLVFAQSSGRTVNSIQELSQFIILLINNIAVPIIFALAFLFFIWGVFKAFIYGDEKSRSEGRQYILWSIIGFFVMISVWGLVRILTGSIAVDNRLPSQTNQLPQAAPIPANVVR